MWAIKSLVLEVLLSLEFEKFYMALDNILDTCVLKRTSCCSGLNPKKIYRIFILFEIFTDERKLYKNIDRLYRTVFEKMAIYGMFQVDATLPLVMTSTTTSFTLLLLQLAFL
ncbi:hypothetical protein HF086_006422 [Spodoptera exigua]|uniref:Uncharacterized protein n=1 Tax=Spodoptera exigua TaxID=7107 RepID=A0A922MX23_SPOEX|nr:hypothetical protein HF086_006422 [Spodoptera exigua]